MQIRTVELKKVEEDDIINYSNIVYYSDHRRCIGSLYRYPTKFQRGCNGFNPQDHRKGWFNFMTGVFCKNSHSGQDSTLVMSKYDKELVIDHILKGNSESNPAIRYKRDQWYTFEFVNVHFGRGF